MMSFQQPILLIGGYTQNWIIYPLGIKSILSSNMKKIICILVCSLFISIIGYSQNNVIQKTERISNKLYVVENGNRFLVDTTRIVVKTKKSLDNSGLDIKPIYRHRLGFLDIPVPQNTDIVDYAEKLRKTGLFEFVELITECKLLSTNSIQETETKGSFLTEINAINAWKFTMGSPSVKVAILDCGIKRDHEDLGYGNDGYSNVSYTQGHDYINNTLYTAPVGGHATRVAGILGAKANNSIGIAGVAGGNHSQGVTMLSYRITYNDESSFTNVDDAICDAVNAGAKVINMSITTSSQSTIDEAIDYAYNHGVSIVCGSGNNNSSSLGYPASNSKTISVGALNNNTRWQQGSIGSNYGYGLDLVAPGTNIETTNVNTNYTSYYNGTSLAAAQVSGAVALMLSLVPTLTPSKTREILINSAIKIPQYTSSGWHQEVGYGKLNVYGALKGIFNITGPSFICTSATYNINNLPSDFSVNWSYHPSNTAPQPVLTQNSPSTNQCTIVNPNHYPYDGTLTATVYRSGQLVFTLTKHVVSMQNDNYSATYRQEACGYYNVSHPAISEQTISGSSTTFVHQGCKVIVQSPWFVGRTISHSGCTPETWSYDGNETVAFSLPLNSGGIPFHILAPSNGDGGCNCNIDLLFFSYSNNRENNNSLNIIQSEENITFEIVHNEELNNHTLSTQEKKNSSSNGWKIEIYSMNPVKKIFERFIKQNCFTFETYGLEKGIYIVNATIDGEILTDKFYIE